MIQLQMLRIDSKTLINSQKRKKQILPSFQKRQFFPHNHVHINLIHYQYSSVERPAERE